MTAHTYSNGPVEKIRECAATRTKTCWRPIYILIGEVIPISPTHSFSPVSERKRLDMSRNDIALSFFASTVVKQKRRYEVFTTVGRLISKLNMLLVRNAVLNQGTILCKKTIPTVWHTSEDKVPYSINVIGIHTTDHSCVSWNRLFTVPRARKNMYDHTKQQVQFL